MPINTALEVKLIKESAVPSKKLGKTEDWLSILRKIPRGEALVATEKELGVTGTSVKIVVNRYVKNGIIPPTYRVSQRSNGDEITVYIINSAEEPIESSVPSASVQPVKVARKRGRPPKHIETVSTQT